MTSPLGDPLNLNDQNPWPALAAYDEASRDFFRGRDEEAAEVFRLVRLAPLTVVYGKSGLGKTSLLQAGLYPLLRDGHYLPIHLRIDFSGTASLTPFQQVMQRLKEELDKTNADYPAFDHEEVLWEYLHRMDFECWNPKNFLLTPVLVFDPFEELFSHSDSNGKLIERVFDELADLIENRVPTETSDATGARRSQLDLLSQRYRVVLSFREDFLPEVKKWEHKIPSLLRNYLRLHPMSRQRAIKAVEEAGKAVLCEGVAPRIVDLVAKPGHAEGTIGRFTVEPVLLSLCCSQLNLRRSPGACIDEALVLKAGQDILDRFYREVLDDPAVKGPPDATGFIEDYLIQGDNFRGNYPKDEALNRNLISKDQLKILTDRYRLLRIAPYPDTPRVELIHDRLVPVVRKARDERKIKQHQDEQERLAKEAQAETSKERARSDELKSERDAARRYLKTANQMRNIAIVAGIVIVILCGALVAWRGRVAADAQQRAQEQTQEAVKRKMYFETALLIEGRQGLGPGMEPLDQIMYRGLVAYRLSRDDRENPKTRVASLTLLHSAMEHTGNLRKTVTISNLTPTPAFAYSPNGKTLAVGGVDGVVRLVDAETYVETGTLDCEQSIESVWSLAYNNDGTRLAAGYVPRDEKNTGSGLVCEFDVLKRKRLHTWSDTPGGVNSVAYGGTPGSEFVISGGSDNPLRVFDLKTGEVRKLSPVQKGITTVVSAGDLMASGGEDGIIRLWDLSKPNPQPKKLEGHEATVQQIVFSPKDPNLLVSAGDDGRIIVWDVKRSCRVQESDQQLWRIYSLAVSPNGLIAAGGPDGKVRFYWLSERSDTTSCNKSKGNKTAILSPTMVFQGHGGIILGAAFNPKGSLLATTAQDGSIRFWSGKNLTSFINARLKMDSNDASVKTLAISPDDEYIAAGDDKGNIHLWRRPKEKSDFTEPSAIAWNAHDKAIRSLVFVRIGSQLAIVSGGDDGILKCWNASSRKIIYRDQAQTVLPVQSIALAPAGTILAVGSSDGTIRLRDVATGKFIRSFEGNPQNSLESVSFSGDGKYLAVGGNAAGLRILNLAEPKQERYLQGAGLGIRSLSARKGGWLSAGFDGHILEWQQTALEHSPIVSLKKHDEFKWRLGSGTPLTSIDTSKDGRLILAGGKRGRLELWDSEEHTQIAAHLRRFNEDSDIEAVALAPDGGFFVSASKVEVLVSAGPDQWADIMCAKLMRNMSRKEWREQVSPDIEYHEQCPGLPIPPDAPEQQPPTVGTGKQ